MPNRPDRRWATDRLLAYLLFVLRDYRLANPGAPPVLVGDLSLPYGGPFGSDFGGLGHASHQNGLDVDVLYPRLDGRLLPPGRVADVDRALRAGPRQPLRRRRRAVRVRRDAASGSAGRRRSCRSIAHHNDHVHVRIANWRR